MNNLSKVYRTVAVLTLLLFTGSILLPAGIAASSLNCDMETENCQHACHASGEMGHHQSEQTDSSEVCSFGSICFEAVDENPTDLPAVQQNSKVLIAATLTKETISTPADFDRPEIPRDESAAPIDSPPIFLLNSTFLN